MTELYRCHCCSRIIERPYIPYGNNCSVCYHRMCNRCSRYNR